MASLTRILFVLLTLRLLMTPGICACKASGAAVVMLADVLHATVPPPPQEPADDDHAPGCPASPLAAGMGVAPPVDPLPVPLPSLDCPHPCPILHDAPTGALSRDGAGPPAGLLPSVDGPLYLTLCALLV